MAGVASRLGSGVVLAGWSGCVGVLVVPGVWFGGRGGVAVWRSRLGCRSGERGDVSVGGEDVGGGGPSVEDADDVASGFTNDAGGCVPQLPAQPFGQRPGQGPGDTERGC